MNEKLQSYLRIVRKVAIFPFIVLIRFYQV